MNPEHWQQVSDLLAQALERPEELRDEFLCEAANGDASLIAEVSELLAAGSARAGFLETPLLQSREPRDDASLSAVGPYELERELGRGGMGAVYLARRSDGVFRREVAIKVIKRGMDSEQVIHRFEQERQILAALEHPYIARLYDGGTAADGRPFFVMEYVQGERIDWFCDRNGLSARQRLDLFAKVCDAVHYAHQHLVVHRDLKPSNVLVTAEGSPVLLDFGIATLLAPDDGASTAIAGEGEEHSAHQPTALSQRHLTLGYASPEQLRGERTTTACDVYSLGVLLYKLLTGRLPFEAESSEASAWLRLIEENDPLPPGRAAGAVDRDLDNVVLRALRREPERRYRSAAEFGVDIRRFLAGLPVAAGPGSRLHHARKFIRRHWRWVLPSFVLVAALAVFSAVVAALLAETGKQRDRATQEAERATQEARTSAQLTDFLLGVFEVSDPQRASGATVTAKELLERGVGRAERDLEGQPRSLARILETMGLVFGRLGLLDRSGDLLKKSLELRKQALGEDHNETASSLGSLASCYLMRGEFEAAEPLLLQAVRIQEAQPEPRDRKLGANLDNLGNLYRLTARHDLAEEYYRRALALREVLPAPYRQDVVFTLNHYGLLHKELGRYEAAERLLQRALAALDSEPGSDQVRLAQTLGNLGALYLDRGEPRRAAEVLTRSLRIKEQILGREHPALGSTLNDLGEALLSGGGTHAARAAFERAIQVKEAALGHHHPSVAFSLHGLASVAAISGDLGRAQRLFDQALAIRVAALGRRHVLVAQTLHELARVHGERGAYAESERLLEEALEILRGAQVPPEHTIAVTETLARIYTAWGRYEEAEGRFHDAAAAAAALPSAPKVPARRDLLLASVALGQGQLLDRLGRRQEARRAWERALGASSAISALELDTREIRAAALCLLGREREAREDLAVLQQAGWLRVDPMSSGSKLGLLPAVRCPISLGST